MSHVWQYRTLCMPGLEIAKYLNDAGREGFEVLYTDHSFQGPDASGVTYVILGRKAPLEVEEPTGHTIHAVVVPHGH